MRIQGTDATTQDPHVGAVTQAWRDVVRSPGCARRVLLLALVQLVPVLNFVVGGYALLWACEVPKGSAGPLPKKVVSGVGFGVGFLAWALNALCMSAVTTVLSLLFFLGDFLLYLQAAAYIFFCPFITLALVRMTLRRRLGAVFGFSQLAALYKLRFGKIMVACWAPGMVAALAQLVVELVERMARTVVVSAGAQTYAFSASSESSTVLVVAMTLVVIAFYFAAAAVSAITSLVMYRAYGYIVARSAPGWVRPPQRPVAPAPPAYPPFPEPPQRTSCRVSKTESETERQV